MTLVSFSSSDSPALTARHAVALFVIGALLAGVMQFLNAQDFGADIALDQLFSSRLNSYANLLLLAATGLYLAHLAWRAPAVGLWASALALLGALGLLGSLLAYGSEPYHKGYAPLVGMHEMLLLFAAFTVLIYLAMEKVYRTRSAGAFVLPIVAAAVLFDVWSGGRHAPGGALPILRSYALRAHVLSNLVAYGAFAVAAALAAMQLLRGPLGARAGKALPDAPRTARLIHLALALGLVLFSLGALFGMRIAQLAWGRYWGWDPKECWALLVWAAYGAYFLLYYWRRWRGARLALWVLFAFALTVFGFLGLQLGASLHTYD
ncbi:MAG: cytochrome c biogenesis protein CcsA [Pseudomonadota bacterium]